MVTFRNVSLTLWRNMDDTEENDNEHGEMLLVAVSEQFCILYPRVFVMMLVVVVVVVYSAVQQQRRVQTCSVNLQL